MRNLVLVFALFFSVQSVEAATLQCIASNGSGFKGTAILQEQKKYEAPSAKLTNLSVKIGSGDWKAIQGEGYAVLSEKGQVEIADVVDLKWNVILAIVNHYGNKTSYSNHEGTFESVCTLSK